MTRPKIKNWHDIDWKFTFNKVRNAQDSIVKAELCGNRKEVYKLQRALVISFCARAIAVRRVTTSSGGKTPGLDKVKWDSPKKRFEAIEELGRIVMFPKNYKSQPVKLVMIPKPGTTELRPLGIPVMIDRALQSLYLLAVDPVVEVHSDTHSYGFRANKSTHDAILRIKHILDKPWSCRFILETDVEKCFDRISHEFLIEHTPICDKNILRQWLKSGVAFEGDYKPSLRGTPQGGVISPMLCNIALNGLEEIVAQKAKQLLTPKQLYSIKLHVIRYADDFIVTCASKELLEDHIYPTIVSFLDARGLNMKKSKTRIINILEGFDFLGFNIRRFTINTRRNRFNKLQKSILVIRANRKSIQNVTNRIKEEVDKDKPLSAVIRDLNPIISGWSEYFRITYHSIEIFWKLGHYVWRKMWNWAGKRHPRRTAKTLHRMYVIRAKGRKWNFGTSNSGTIFDISRVTRRLKYPLKEGLNPYLLENR